MSRMTGALSFPVDEMGLPYKRHRNNHHISNFGRKKDQDTRTVQALKWLYHEDRLVTIADLSESLGISYRGAQIVFQNLRGTGLLAVTRPQNGVDGRGFPGYQFKLLSCTRKLLKGDWLDS